MAYKVSVVCIVYNTRDWLEPCLTSLYNQTLDSVELILINNASEDDTTKILEESIQGKEHVYYIKNETNIGGAAAGNQGIHHASGEYIMLMDSDDILPKRALEVMYKKAKEKDCDVVIGRAKSIKKKKVHNLKFHLDWITWSQELLVEDIIEAPWITTAPFYWGRLFRREFLLANQIFMIEKMLNADRYFTVKALKLSKKTAVIHEDCYYWRRFAANSKNSVTSNKGEVAYFLDRYESTLQVEGLFDPVLEKDLYDYVRAISLIRLFIPITHALKDEEFYQVYCRTMTEYLQTYDIQELLSNVLLRSKEKCYSYLLYIGNYSLLRKYVENKLYGFSYRLNGREVWVYPFHQELPKAARTEIIRRVKTCTAKLYRKAEEGYVFSGRVAGYARNRVELTHVYLMQGNKKEKRSIQIQKKKNLHRKLTYEFTLEYSQMKGLKKGKYYFSLEYIVAGRVKRKRISKTGLFHRELVLHIKGQNLEVSSWWKLLKRKIRKVIRGK